MHETNRIEYKRELNIDVDIEKEVISFLNYHEGGLIYIGIDKQGKIFGVVDIDGDMLKIKDRIKNNISPSAMGLFDIVAETREGKELIKIIMVEQLGSGTPRILQAYSKDCFKLADSYLRLTFPATEQVTTQVTTQVEELIKVFTREHTRQELQEKLNLANREHFRKNYLQPALDVNLIELTIPEKPNSSKQKYRLTEKGILVKNN